MKYVTIFHSLCVYPFASAIRIFVCMVGHGCCADSAIEICKIADQKKPLSHSEKNQKLPYFFSAEYVFFFSTVRCIATSPSLLCVSMKVREKQKKKTLEICTYICASTTDVSTNYARGLQTHACFIGYLICVIYSIFNGKIAIFF